MTFGAIKTFDNKFISNNVVESIYPIGVLEVAPGWNFPAGAFNEPLGDPVTKSLEKLIRFTVDTDPPGL